MRKYNRWQSDNRAIVAIVLISVYLSLIYSPHFKVCGMRFQALVSGFFLLTSDVAYPLIFVGYRNSRGFAFCRALVIDRV